MANIATASVLIVPSFKGMKGNTQKALQGIDPEFDKAGKRSGGALSRGVRRVATAGLVAGGAALAAGLGAALTKGFQRLAAIDTAEQKLLGLGHSAEMVETIMTNALNSVKGTAFGLDEAATVSAALVASGIKPGQELENTLRTVADSATIAGIGMDEMGAIFGKVAATGRLQGDELNQLSERGIPALQLLSDHLGVTADEVREMVSRGEVDFQTFSDAMEAGMGGAALKSGETFVGAWKNVGAALGRIGATLLAPFFEAAKGGMGGLTAILDSINDALQPVMDAFGEWLSSIDWVAVGQQMGQLFQPLWQAIQPLLPALLEAWQKLSPIGILFQALAPIGQQLAGVIGQLAGTVAGVLAQGLAFVLPILAQVATVIATVLTNGIRVALPIITMLAQMLGPILGVALRTLAPIVMAVVTAFMNLVTALMPVTTAIMQLIASLLPPLMNLFMALAPVLVFVGELVGFLARVIGGALVLAVNILTPVIQFLANMLGVILPIAINIVTGVLNLLMGIVRAVGAVFMWLWVNAIQPAWNGIVLAVQLAWTFLQPIFTLIVNVVRNILAAAFTFLWNTALLVWSGIQSAITFAWAFISPIFNFIVNAIKNYLIIYFQLLWTVVQLVWKSIQIAIQVAWVAIKIVFDAIVAFVKNVLGPAFSWFYNNLIKPVWDGIKWYIDTTWTGIKIIFNAIKSFLENTLGPAFSWFYNNLIKPVWDGIKSSINTVWTFVRDKVFDPMKNAVENSVPDAFRAGKDAIKEAWDKVKDVAKKPVKFVIDTVINKGIIKNFNKIADIFDVDKIDEVSLPEGFARGGHTGPGSKYKPAGIVHADEFVVQKSSRRRFERENPGALDHLNRTGRLPMLGGYAAGGRVGTLWDAAQWWIQKGARASRHSWFNGGRRITSGHSNGSLHYSDQAVDFNMQGTSGTSAKEQAFFDRHIGTFQSLFPGIRTIWRAKDHYDHLHIDTSKGANMGGGGDGGGLLDILNPFEGLFDKIKEGITSNGMFGELVAGGAKQMVQAPIDWIKSKADWLVDIGEDVVDAVGTGTTKARVRAMAMGRGWGTGQQWRDLSALIQQESSWDKNAANPTSSARGLFQKMTSLHGPLEKTVEGQASWGLNYIKNTYGSPSAAWAFHKRNNWYDKGGHVAPTKYDNGGWLKPGITTVLNATRKPEPVFTNDQWQELGRSSGQVGARINIETIEALDADDAIRKLYKKDHEIRAHYGVMV